MSSSAAENVTRLGGNGSNDRPQVCRSVSAPAISNNLIFVEDDTDSLSGGNDASGTPLAASEQLIMPTEGLTETELEELAQAPLPERVAADLSRYWSGEPQPGTRTPREIPPDIFAHVLMSPAVDYPLPRSIGFTLREWIMTEKIHYAPSMRIMGRAIKARNEKIADLKLKFENIARHGSDENEITRLKAQIVTLELAAQEMQKELSDKIKDLDIVENDYLDMQEEYNLLKAGAAINQQYTETKEQFHKRMIKAVLHEIRYQKELEGRIKILNRTIDDQNLLLDQHISNMQPGDAEIVHMRRAESGLSRAYESLELEHDALRQNLRDLQDAHEELKEKFSEEYTLRKELERYHDGLNKNFLKAQTELKKLHAAKQAVDVEVGKKEDDLKHKNIEIEEIADWLQKARAEIHQANRKISRLQMELQSAQTVKEELAFIENQRAGYESGYQNNGDLKYDILVISDDLDKLTIDKEQREKALEQEIKRLKRKLRTCQRALARNTGGLGIMMGGNGDNPEVSDLRFPANLTLCMITSNTLIRDNQQLKWHTDDS